MQLDQAQHGNLRTAIETENSAIAHAQTIDASITTLSQMKLTHWESFMRTFTGHENAVAND